MAHKIAIVILIIIVGFLPGVAAFQCPSGKYQGRRRLSDEVQSLHHRLSGRNLYGSACITRYGCPPSSVCLSCHVTDEGCNCVEPKPNCYDCNAGKYGVGCKSNCPAGKYGGGRGEKDEKAGCPSNCPLGTFGTQWGSIQSSGCPRTCPAGKYAIQDANLGQHIRDSEAHACSSCPQGYYCVGNTGDTVATTTECPVGKYGNVTGQKTEAKGCNGICPKGRYGTASGKSSVADACTVCPADHYCDGNKNTMCPTGYSTLGNTGVNSAAGCKLCSNDCTTCPQNTYSIGNGNCAYCPETTPTTTGVAGAADKSACTICGKGYGFKNYGTAAGTCYQCDVNFRGVGYGLCAKCGPNEIAAKGSSECFSPSSLKKQFMSSMDTITARQGGIIKAVALSNAKSNEVKQKAKGLVAKLSLDWATQDVINQAQKIRDELAALPAYNVSNYCNQEKQRLNAGVIRTGVIIPMDAEIDNKYCLNENRNTLISAFCNFRPRFIKLLKEKAGMVINPPYTGRDLWPNICCRKDNFEHFRSCSDPAGVVPRAKIVPFALAQGGNVTVENLYGELVDVLKVGGYLQQGMNKAIDGIKNADKLKKKINDLFETTLLCGPREFGLPTNEAIRLCELFYPYEHMLGTYFDEVNQLLQPLQRRRRLLGVWAGMKQMFAGAVNSANAFMFGNTKTNVDGSLDDSNVRVLQAEVRHLTQEAKASQAEMGVLKREAKKSKEKIYDLEQQDAVLEEKNTVIEERSKQANKILSILRENGNSRRLGIAEEMCPVVTMGDMSTYLKEKETFCTGYSHIDLNHPGKTVNLAIMAPWDIPKSMIVSLREQARYEISDSCPTPMFSPKDISLQNIDETDLFVIQLDSTSPNGYLKRELPLCGTANNVALKPHIPKTTIDVKIWRDHESCCADTKDYNVCKAIGCLSTDEPNGIEPVKDPWTNLQVGYSYKVIGTTYTATCDNKPGSKPCSSTSRRRQLLQDVYGNSGERL
jgi:hypothetical protein